MPSPDSVVPHPTATHVKPTQTSLRRHGWLLLPLVFSLYPVVAHLAANIGEVPPADAGRALLASIILAYLLLGLLWLASGRDGDRAALAAVGILTVFFAYGHARLVTKGLVVAGVVVGRHRHLVPLSLSMLAAWVWFVMRRLPEPYRLTTVFLAVGVVSLIAPARGIISGHMVQALHPQQLRPYPAALDGTQSLTLQQPQDIYFIVLDGYARADILEDVYAFDNSKFLDALEARGFYIAAKSRSNYNSTALSLSSTLNYEYIPDLLGRELTASDRNLVAGLINHSRVRTQLEALGYQTVAFDSGFQPTLFQDADRFIRFEEQGDRFTTQALPFILNPFEGSLIGTTALQALEEKVPGLSLRGFYEVNYEDHRRKVRGILNTLREIPTWDGEFFVVAHIISPHPPFVFAADGSPIAPDRPFSFADADNFLNMATSEEYRQRYPEQLVYINGAILETVDQILQRSTVPPIIVIEGDHGARASMVFNSAEESDLRETFSNLNAYYLPEGGAEDLYPSITPVDTFRVILNRYFGTRLPLLPDRTFFYERPAIILTEVAGFE